MKSSYLFALVLALFAFNAQASLTVNDLLRSGEFSVSTQLSKSKNVVVGEQVRVIIDLQTSTWFTKGTEIKRFAVNNAIVLMEQANVVNSSTRIDGKTYSSQRWEVPIYPLSSGVIDIPPISVLVSVKGKQEDIFGKVTTQPIQLTTHLASENMSSNVVWVVADEARLTEKTSQVSDNDIDNELFVGDSVTKTVSLHGTGTSAMLMPNIMEPLVWPESTRVYVSQPKRADNQARGVSSATYEQEVTLIMQQPGIVVFPEIKVLWWNSDTQQEQWLILPEQEWQVSHTLGSYINMYWMELSLCVAAGMLLLFAFSNAIQEFMKRDKEGRLPLFVQFWQAVHRNQEARAQSIVYRKLLKRHKRYQLIDGTKDASWDRDAVRLQECYKSSHSGADIQSLLRRIWRQVSK
ncbi:BatD [Vibrio maritimus]|uniref:BatD n=1 Tax=Vibrio maritimus TaxID=990268 RepID=A0A090T0N7_9VIBR|nr:BatD [Vibrio maritimus]